MSTEWHDPKQAQAAVGNVVGSLTLWVIVPIVMIPILIIGFILFMEIGLRLMGNGLFLSIGIVGSVAAIFFAVRAWKQYKEEKPWN